jgi:diaminopimelate decarboxylase
VGEGDYLALMSAGAYGFVMASNYNARATAVEVLVQGSKSAVVRERQKLPDIWKDEKLPAWLK